MGTIVGGWVGESLQALVRAVPCKCGDCCCEACSSAVAARKARRFESDCDRLGIRRLNLITFTRDPSRFPDPRHLLAGDGKYQRFFDALWAELPRYGFESFLIDFPEPVWQVFLEVHDGKRSADSSVATAARDAVHAHAYMPSLSDSGRIPKGLLEFIVEQGQALSGRTTWGWQRQRVYAMPVRDASGYASKGLRYAVKGAAVSGPMADSRFHLVLRSRTFTESDPVNVAARGRRVAAESARASAVSGALSELDGQRAGLLASLERAESFGLPASMRHDLHVRLRAVERSQVQLRKGPVKAARGPLRSRAERRAGCLPGWNLFATDGRARPFLGRLDGSVLKVRQHLAEELLCWEQDPDAPWILNSGRVPGAFVSISPWGVVCAPAGDLITAVELAGRSSAGLPSLPPPSTAPLPLMEESGCDGTGQSQPEGAIADRNAVGGPCCSHQSANGISVLDFGRCRRSTSLHEGQGGFGGRRVDGLASTVAAACLRLAAGLGSSRRAGWWGQAATGAPERPSGVSPYPCSMAKIFLHRRRARDAP